MMSFQKKGIRVFLNINSVNAYVNHPNMGRLLLFKLDSNGFSTPLRTSESWIKSMLVNAGMLQDERIKSSALFNNWFYKN